MRRVRRAGIAWVAIALAGLLVAAALTLAASRIAGQSIGIASEPPGAGNRLAPTRATPPVQPRPRQDDDQLQPHREPDADDD